MITGINPLEPTGINVKIGPADAKKNQTEKQKALTLSEAREIEEGCKYLEQQGFTRRQLRDVLKNVKGKYEEGVIRATVYILENLVISTNIALSPEDAISQLKAQLDISADEIIEKCSKLKDFKGRMMFTAENTEGDPNLNPPIPFEIVALPNTDGPPTIYQVKGIEGEKFEIHETPAPWVMPGPGM